MDRALAQLPIALCEMDADGRLTSANDAFRALALGGAPLTHGVAPWSHAVPAIRAEMEARWLAARSQNATFTATFTVSSLDGSETVIALSVAPVRETSGGARRYVGTAQDITTVASQDRLNEQLVGALDAARDAIVVYDASMRLVFANRGATEVLGIADTPNHDNEAATTFFDAVRNQVPRDLLTGTTHNSWTGELGHRSPDGFMRTLLLTLHVVRGVDSTVDHYSVIARDVTEHKQLQSELQRQATHDELTGLPNRTLFLRRVAEALDRSRTLRRGVTVMFLDFDGLKHVNDTIGHRFGDQLIVSVGKRLVNATRPSDVVARLSGDEFAVLAEGVGDESLALEIAERLRASVTGQHVIHGVEVTSGASVGVAIASAALLDEQSPSDAALTLLVNSDTAMYRAKQRGKGRCEIYSEAMRTEARDRLALASQLERALAGNELTVAYQPIVSLHTGRVVAIEALLRWNHPQRGLLTPPEFLEVAEETGAIGPIGDWVIAQSAETSRDLRADGTLEPTTTVHINVSPRQLSDAGFVERTTHTLDAADLGLRHLVLEFTESTALAGNAAITRSLNALARLDARLSIDDFGTGYSSLAHLRDFRAAQLKLDGTFIRNIGRESTDDPVVRSIVQLAHSLDMSVVAEWVQSAEQLQRLRLLGCDHAQGNYVCEPTTPAGIREFVDAIASDGIQRVRHSGGTGAGPLPE
ncbi:MAG: putative bifunctional diguanylate cyclase/phosphodiesterase [Ilumatobacteraceae bacterium]